MVINKMARYSDRPPLLTRLKPWLNLTLLVMVTVLTTPSVSAETLSFGQAKKKLTAYYADLPQTQRRSFYCDCALTPFTPQGASKSKRKLLPNWQSCGFQPRKNAKRAGRIEWEHLMPAHHFGQHLACWRNGGRKACRKDPTFKQMEGDMHNLVPAIGEVNGDRSNYKFGMLVGENRVYGQCDAEVNFKQKRFEPAESTRGDIARAYFYMADRYQVRLSQQQRQLLQAWHRLDPADPQEIAKNRWIKSIQGNTNPYIPQ